MTLPNCKHPDWKTLPHCKRPDNKTCTCIKELNEQKAVVTMMLGCQLTNIELWLIEKNLCDNNTCFQKAVSMLI